MKPEEFEVYVIPPNFMEGGTLFGGLLKTRNTIEAVILGLAVGVPVLHLPFSLTVRVVILCLTALPLVLLALIGVSGMSLSAFIRLFFCFLHNRRILSRDGTQGGKNGKTLLPSWAQQRKSDCEAEDPPLPKSRSRFSVDLKQRSVTQFKTFLQEEEAVQPLNALADYIPIEKIESMIDSIEGSIFESADKEISSTRIGEIVMEHLKDLDAVAYVRFASVYREFMDVSTFMDELKKFMEP